MTDKTSCCCQGKNLTVEIMAMERFRIIQTSTATNNVIHRFLVLCIFISGEYQQNICSYGDILCTPCRERLPSCRGLSDGNHPVPWKLWSNVYFSCFRNRTIYFGLCEKGTFDPNRKICISEISTSKFS